MFAPANIENVDGLTLSQEGKPQTHSNKVCDVQHNSDFSQQVIKYELQLKCMLVRCGCPLPGNHSIVPVLTAVFYGSF